MLSPNWALQTVFETQELCLHPDMATAPGGALTGSHSFLVGRYQYEQLWPAAYEESHGRSHAHRWAHACNNHIFMLACSFRSLHRTHTTALMRCACAGRKDTLSGTNRSARHSRTPAESALGGLGLSAQFPAALFHSMPMLRAASDAQLYMRSPGLALQSPNLPLNAPWGSALVLKVCSMLHTLALLVT